MIRTALAPFAWLGAALATAAVLALVALTISPSLGPKGVDLAGWNPFQSVIELELPGASNEEIVSFVEAAADAFPERVVERGSGDRSTWIVVVGSAKSVELVRETKGLASDLGLETGLFTMGSNLGRVSARLLEDPRAAIETGARLLPLTLLIGGGVLLLFGALLRRRLPPDPTRQVSHESLARRLALGVGLGLLLGLVIQGVSMVAAYLGAPIVEQPWLADAFDTGGAYWIAVLFAVLVLAPVGEEVFFRGYLCPALVSPWGRTGAVVLSSATFAAIHGHAPALPAYFIYGVGLAVAANRTGSLLVPVAAHMTVNSLAVITLVWGTR